MPGGRAVQLGMCVMTAVLGALLVVVGGSELGLFGWVFLALGGLGALMWVVLPSRARR